MGEVQEGDMGEAAVFRGETRVGCHRDACACGSEVRVS